MRKMLTRACCLALALSLSSTPINAAKVEQGVKEEEEKVYTGVQTGDYAETVKVDFSKFTDVKGHWAEKHLEWAVKNGIMSGMSETEMNPNGYITRGQVATMVTRAFGASKRSDVSMFVDLPADAWYTEYISKAVQMGCLTGFGNAIAPEQHVQRQEVASILVKAAGYTITDTGNLKNFKDVNKAEESKKKYLATAVYNGIMSGNGDNTITPTNLITRAEFAAMMRNIAEAYMTKYSIYTEKVVEGSLMVGVGNLILDGMTIKNDVFLSDGVGTGSIRFETTKISDTVYVRGTGPNTVEFTNGSTAKSVVLANPNNAVKLEVDESSSVSNVTVQDAVGTVTLNGNIGNVIVNCAKAPIKLVGCNTASIRADAPLTNLAVDSNSSVSYLRTSDGSKVEIKGHVGTVDVVGMDVSLTINGTVDKLCISPSVRNLKLAISGDASVGSLEATLLSSTLDLAGTIRSVDLECSDSVVNFNTGFKSEDVSISGVGSTLSFNGASTVDDVWVAGVEDLALEGNGTVTKITVNSGEGVYISIPNVTVYNKGGEDVFIGSDEVGVGETVKANSTGSGIYVEPPKQEGNQNNNQNNNQNGSTNQNGSNSSPETTSGPFLISFDANGGSVGLTAVRTNTKGVVPALPVPARAGYVFDGWYTTKIGGTNVKAGTITNADITVFAHWSLDGNSGVPLNELSLSAAAGANPSDFGNNGTYSLSTFGSNLSYNSLTAKISGRVNYLENFFWYSGARRDYATGFYVPLVLSPANQTESATLSVGGATFSNEVVSNGLNLKGKWIVYIPCDPYAEKDSRGRQTVRVGFDADGPGSNYFPQYVDVDYTDVIYYGADVNDAYYMQVDTIDGVDGGEKATVETTKGSDGVITYHLTTKSLLETKDSNGRFGNWTGLEIPMPAGANYLNLAMTLPDGTKETKLLYRTYDSDTNSYIIRWMFDASCKTADNKNITVVATWLDNNNATMDNGVRNLVVDLTNCVLAGESTDATNTSVKDFAVSMVSEEECVETFGKSLSYYTSNYNLTGNKLGGSVYLDTDGRRYAPLKFTGVSGGSISVKDYNGVALFTVGEAGAFSKIVKVPVYTFGPGAEDIKVTASGANLTDSSIVIDTSAVDVSTYSIMLNPEFPGGTILGNDTSAYISNPSYSLQFGSLEILGELKKFSDFDYYGVKYDTIWLAPVEIELRTSIEDWEITVGYNPLSEGDVTTDEFGNTVYPAVTYDEVKFTKEDLVDGKLKILVPFKIGDNEWNSVNVDLFDKSAQDVGFNSFGTIYFGGTYAK